MVFYVKHHGAIGNGLVILNLGRPDLKLTQSVLSHHSNPRTLSRDRFNVHPPFYMKPSNVLRFHSTGPGFKSRAAQDRLRLSPLQWID
ncbi:hypothetical protein TNCV_2482701 [Trichonephila clavipes]|uniref:Uncharacterized protein n=1 Tax=Trichonephila clavipes TaxID=2585209 RepID=A0A8X6VZ67_TRICX|nr:hypothetical protein TNCV_2482701 [Trichonephila clavipes]